MVHVTMETDCQSYFSMGVELVVQPHWLPVCELWCRTVHDPPSYFTPSQPGRCHDVTLSVAEQLYSYAI